MTDDIDWLGLTDPLEQAAARGPALVVPPKMGPRELAVAEQMHRMADAPAANRLMFIDVDEETGKEIWAVRALGDRIDEGQRWRAIMKWPRVPTIAEAEGTKLSAITARLASWWDRLAVARDLDERYGYDNLDDRQPEVGSK